MDICCYYIDRFYENKRNGKFVKITIAIPAIILSGLRVFSSGFDGDLEVVIGF
tara:strand:+ start:158 stop:316 length:159 start_codon:yes stop_codon:yes gene_type:complete